MSSNLKRNGKNVLKKAVTGTLVTGTAIALTATGVSHAANPTSVSLKRENSISKTVKQRSSSKTSSSRTVVLATPTDVRYHALPYSKTEKKPLTAEQRYNLKRWGVVNLPVPASKLKKYQMGKKNVRDLIASKKWAKQPKAKKIRHRESRNNYRINTGNGYYGAYQFAYGTWLSNGGGRFSRYAHNAPKWAQDYVAYKTWQKAGWQPWGG